MQLHKLSDVIAFRWELSGWPRLSCAELTRYRRGQTGKFRRRLPGWGGRSGCGSLTWSKYVYKAGPGQVTADQVQVPDLTWSKCPKTDQVGQPFELVTLI